MPMIGPYKALKDLEDLEGKGEADVKIGGPLPEVRADVAMKPEADAINRRLDALISAALDALKPPVDGKPLFVLAWRMYPNAEHPFWQEYRESHACGCSCFGHAP